MIVDYHLHLRPDGDRLDDDAYDPAHLARYVAAGEARGVAEIAITEHVYRFADARHLADHEYWLEQTRDDLGRYVDGVSTARDGGLPVLLGIELDWLGAGSADGVRALAEGTPWDVVLGSVHWDGPLAFDHPDYSIWDAFGVEEVWRRYVDELCEAAMSGVYDVMAHPDLAKVFGHRPGRGALAALGEQVAEAFREAGVCAEISSSGLRKAAEEVYPSADWLGRLQRAGVPVTLASDAHLPEDVGIGVDRCVGAAHAAGYREVTRFRGRDRQAVPLG